MAELKGIEDEEDAFFFEVEKILEMEMRPNGRWFYIKWKNYPESCENSWEPEDNLNCHEIKENFLRRLDEKKKTKKKKRGPKPKKNQDIDLQKTLVNTPSTSTSKDPMDLSDMSISTTSSLSSPEASSMAEKTTPQKRKKPKKSNLDKTSNEQHIVESTKNTKKKKKTITVQSPNKPIAIAPASASGSKEKMSVSINMTSTTPSSKSISPSTPISSTSNVNKHIPSTPQSTTKKATAENNQPISKNNVPKVNTINTVLATFNRHVPNNTPAALTNNKNAFGTPKATSPINNAVSAIKNSPAKSKPLSTSGTTPAITQSSTQSTAPATILAITPVSTPEPSKEVISQHTPRNTPQPTVTTEPTLKTISKISSDNALKITAQPIQKSASNPIHKPNGAPKINTQPIQKSLSNPIQKNTSPVPSSRATTSPLQKNSPIPTQQSPSITNVAPKISTQPTQKNTQQPLPRNSLKLTPNSTTKPNPSQLSPTTPHSVLKGGLKPTPKPSPKPSQPAAFNIDSYLEKMTSHSHPTPQYPAARSSSHAYAQPETPFAHQIHHIRSQATVNHPPRQPYTSTATYPVKRTASSSDPKIPPPALKRSRTEETPLEPFTPLVMSAFMINSKSRIAPVIIETTRTCKHVPEIEKFVDLYGVLEHQKVFRVDWYVPMSRLQQIVNPDEHKDVLIIKATDNLVDLSKLRNFMQVNEVAAIASHPERPTESLAVLPQSEMRKLGYDMHADGAYLYVIYLRDLSARPFFKISGRTDATLYTWSAVTEYVKFPEELLACKNTAQFVIYGHSEVAEMLRKVTVDLEPTKPANPSMFEPAHIMMFDRQNDTLFNKQLTRHKKMPGTQIWEYGVPNLSYGEMFPAQQVFPYGSGGYIMTDMKNMIANPLIIETIIQEMKKINSDIHGEWKFVLPDNFVSVIKKAIVDRETAERAQDVLIRLSIALTKDEIQVASYEIPNQKEYDWVGFAQSLVRSGYHKRQYFVLVDDIHSNPDDVREKHKSIDFVKSSEIFNTFIA